ncbi:hypothetical protein [Marinicella rhabdoformis]|uniref:hypothetical protein n=1 Tax=Marinicella rhabdoformis TaxID=2580566 RepID=UPI0012AEDF28|nr:hypothetical protein [Marinicella rhabdoformis]
MKYINKISILLLFLISYQNANASTNYDVTYCYTCTLSDMKAKAKYKLANYNSKTVFVINAHTDEVNTFEVTKEVEPGFYHIFVRKITGPSNEKMIVENTIQNFKLLKNINADPITFQQLHYRNTRNFPVTAHMMVSSPNAVGQLVFSVSSLLSERASESLLNSIDRQVSGIANKVIGDKELRGEVYHIKFNDGSTVEVIVTGVDIDGNNKNPIVRVSKVEGSMKDSEGNILPDDANGLIGQQFDLGGGGGDANIAAWMSMLNRLRSVGHVSGNRCYWENENQVICPFEDQN